MNLSVLFLLIGIAACATWAMVPLARLIAINAALFDMPSARKVHATPTPLLGGLAIYAGILLSLGFLMVTQDAVRTALTAQWPWLLGASAVVVLGGVWDDATHWPAWWKLCWQLGAASILCWGGMRITVLTNPVQGVEAVLPEWLSVVLTLGWLVAIINAVNLMDGMDGLAAGITAIAAAFLLSIAILLENMGTVYLLAAVIGSCLGFLRYNWPPAQVFMGDAGSQLLGLLVGVAPLLDFQYKAATVVALLIPLTTLAIPLSDTLLAIIRRLQGHRSIFRADKQHLHHRLLELGLSPQQAILLMYVVTAYLGLIAILFVLIPDHHAFILVLLLSLGLFMGMRTIGFIERRLRFLYLQQAKRRRRAP